MAFTTDPKESRSSPYCTDVAKALHCPIFHVNGDDVESVVRVCELAADWRQQWKGDAVVDLVCYRWVWQDVQGRRGGVGGWRGVIDEDFTLCLTHHFTLCVCTCCRKHGHNEIDEPMFTQPLMYKKIRAHKNAHQQYVEKLLAEGTLSKEEVGY